MPVETQLTRGRALSLGALCVVCGAGPVLGAIGTGPFHRAPGVPVWMGRAAGSTFLLAAVLRFANTAAGGTHADGSLPAGTSSLVRFIQSAAGLGIVVLMASMATWIAFGRGERHFSSTVSLPFVAYRSQSAGCIDAAPGVAEPTANGEVARGELRYRSLRRSPEFPPNSNLRIAAILGVRSAE